MIPLGDRERVVKPGPAQVAQIVDHRMPKPRIEKLVDHAQRERDQPPMEQGCQRDVVEGPTIEIRHKSLSAVSRREEHNVVVLEQVRHIEAQARAVRGVARAPLGLPAVAAPWAPVVLV